MSAPSHASVRTYLHIWLWLAGLMLLGVALSELSILPIPVTSIVLIVVGLSTVKALLVALQYHHKAAEGQLVDKPK